MNTYQILIESYLVFGILLTYTVTFIVGTLIGYRQAEKENYYGEYVQSKKEKP